MLFALAAVDTMRVKGEMKVEEGQGYSLGDSSEYSFLEGFVEALVLL